MLEFLRAVVAYIIDPEARVLSTVCYPNGRGMSVREARLNGLYFQGDLITDDKLEHLCVLAKKGGKRDVANFTVSKWNRSNFKGQEVWYKKSEIEGVVLAAVAGPAFIQGDDVPVVKLENFGTVLIEKIEPKFK